MYLKSCSILALVVSTGMANAGGYAEPQPYVPIAPAPQPEPVADYFSGFHVYGGLTVGSNNYDIVGDGVFAFPFIDADDTDLDFDFDLPDLGGEGAGAIIGAGYDFRVGSQAVIGGFLDYSATDINNDTSLDVSGLADVDASIDFKQTSQWTLGARAGFTPSASTLVYGLVGYSRGEFEGDLQGDAEFLGDDYDFDVDGYSLGAGIETMVTENVSLKLEYRYTKYEDFEVFDFDADDFGGASADLETSSHRANMMIGYRF